jgi:Ca-activated chloride channel family protein
MNWEDPNILYALWILPLAGFLMVRSHRKRREAAGRFVDERMVARLMPAFGGARPWLRGIFILFGIGLLIVAGARPRFGEYFEKISQRGVDLLVLLDVSRSMMAEDVSPSRLERAKSDVKDLLKKLPGDRVGLIVFAGKPVVKLPLTSDHGFYRTALDEVNPLSAPRGGTNIGDAVRLAVASLEDRRDRDQVIVLITDGEDHDSFPLEVAAFAAERSIKIFTVGMGDPGEGSRIPVRGENGGLTYLKHEGQEVWSRMDETLLQEMALKTGGAYIPARTRAYDLGEVYENHLKDLARGEVRAEKRKRFKDRYQLFVSFGLFFVLVGMLIAPSSNGGREGVS